jgi:hypothetical protein
MLPVFTSNNLYQTNTDTSLNTFGNLSLANPNPTVSQLNEAISGGSIGHERDSEPVFGTHIGEAKAVLRRIFR